MHKLHCVTVLFNLCNNPPRLCCSYLNFQTKKLKHSGLFKLKSSWLTGSSTCIQTQPTVLLLFSLSAVSSSLWPHGLQHIRLPCPSLSPKFAQTHVHWVGGAIQPSGSLSSTSPDFNLSQHQSLFQWTGSSHQVAKVLELQLQHQSFQWIFRVDFL